MKNLKQKTEEIIATLERIESVNAHLIENDILLQQIRDLYLMAININNMAVQEETVTITQQTSQTKLDNKENIITKNNLLEFDEVEMQKTQLINQSNSVNLVEKIEQVEPINKEPEQTNLTKTNEINIVKDSKKTSQQDLFNSISDSESKTLGEQLGENKTSLNDILAQKTNQKDVATRLTAKPISDIKLAIGIGDKFLFIKELFNGDSENFNNTIEYLNSLQSLDEAISYLNDNFKWNMENHTIKHFINIVQRKYIS